MIYLSINHLDEKEVLPGGGYRENDTGLAARFDIYANVQVQSYLVAVSCNQSKVYATLIYTSYQYTVYSRLHWKGPAVALTTVHRVLDIFSNIHVCRICEIYTPSLT